MRRFRLLLSLALTVFPALALGHGYYFPAEDDGLSNCRRLLAKLSAEVQAGSVQDAFTLNQIDDVLESTVVTSASVSGRHGGKLLTVQRIGKSWLSAHTTVDFDPQGDPRWFIETIGPDAAEFFGFKVLSDTEAVVPDQKEFEAALKKVDAYLEANGSEKISVHFYEPADDRNTPVASYVKEFRENAAIPFAPSGNHRLHDLSFHTGAIFLPQKFVNYMRATLEYEKDFFLHLLKEVEGNPEKATAAKYLRHLTYYANTIVIDSSTAGVNAGIITYLMALKNGDAEADLGRYIDSSEMLTGQGLNPKMALTDLFESFMTGMTFVNYDPARLKATFAALPEREVLASLERFSKNYRSATSPDFVPTRRLGKAETLEKEMCEAITRKREKIREAALKLLQKK